MLIVGFIDSAPDNQYGVNPKGNAEPPSVGATQQKPSPELKDFHYTPEYKPKSDFGSEHNSSSSRPAARLPLKDFN